jgi:hypothetical protein
LFHLPRCLLPRLAPWPLPCWLPCLLLCLSFAAGRAQAQTPDFAARCEARAPSSPVIVLSTPLSYTMDLSLPYREIAQLVGNNKAGAYVLGLTKARFNTRIGYRTTVVVDRNNEQECALPVITVSLSYPSMVVYVGREFAEGSCSYREILMHELKHVQNFQQQLIEVEAAVKQAMGERFSKPVYGSFGQTVGILSREISNTWKPFIMAEQRKVEILQRELDTPEESRRVLRSCNGDVRRILQANRVETPIATGEAP